MVVSLKDKYRPDTIVVKLRGLRKEGLADMPIKPGHLLNRTSTGYEPRGRSRQGRDSGAAMIAVENELFGREITESYAPKGHALYKEEYLNDIVQVEYLNTGAEVRVLCKMHENELLAIGDLMSPGHQYPQGAPGTVTKYLSTLDKNDANKPMGVALEARAATSETTLILMEIL